MFLRPLAALLRPRRGEPRVLVRHEASGRYLGVGLVLVDRDDAVAFDDLAAAQRFVDRHASEPCFHPVLDEPLAGADAAA